MSFSPTLEKAVQPDLELIVDIHRFMRPKGSRTEQLFVDTFIQPLGVKEDSYGNLHKIIPPSGANDTWKPLVLWSCHTDTVHNIDGFQRVVVDEKRRLTLHKNDSANCLGADDGAGVWLMMEMIRAGVPGHYIFHYGEEKGCEGSTKLAKAHHGIFDSIKIAVAFDRRGTTDIITRMGGQKVCSDEFARSLAAQLPQGYKPEPTGSRTDVALYREIIPECTNISVGYSAPHAKTEALDTNHLIDLRDCLVRIDVDKLVVKRDPKEKDYNQTSYPYSGGGHHARHSNFAYECRPRKFEDLFRDAPITAGEMMEAAGIDFDTFLAYALKQQALKRRQYNTGNREIIAPVGWVNPIPNEPPVKPATPQPSQTDMGPPKPLEGTVGQPAETTPTGTMRASAVGGSSVVPFNAGTK